MTGSFRMHAPAQSLERARAMPSAWSRSTPVRRKASVKLQRVYHWLSHETLSPLQDNRFVHAGRGRLSPARCPVVSPILFGRSRQVCRRSCTRHVGN